MKKIFQLLSQINGIAEARYRARVEALIRLRYSQSDEFSLLRQREEKPDEFAAYNAYAEACKRQAADEFCR